MRDSEISSSELSEPGSDCADAATNDNGSSARAKNTAYRLLAFRPRSRAELVTKLKERKYGESVIGMVVKDLERYGYLNDRRFAEQWVIGRMQIRSMGRRRLEQELRSKGLDSDIIRDVLRNAISTDEEWSIAQKAAAKKLQTMKNLDVAVQKRRLAGYLERKGFTSEIILSITRTISSGRT